MIQGVVGQIKWGYYVAAAVNGYHVTRTSQGKWSVRGTVVLSDAFKIAQRPLMFVAPHQGGEWRWPIQSIEIVNGSMTASLGPPEG